MGLAAKESVGNDGGKGWASLTDDGREGFGEGGNETVGWTLHLMSGDDSGEDSRGERRERRRR